MATTNAAGTGATGMAQLKRAKPGQVNYAKLCEAVNRSRISLRTYREKRVEAVRRYAGNNWSEESEKAKMRPVNLLSLYVSIIARSLISKTPRVMLSTNNRQNKPMVSAMESWCNKEIERMGLANTLRRVVIDSLFSIGIIKVALSSPSDSARAGWNLMAGKPFAERVDLDDFVFDVNARDFREVGYIGHRYRVPFDAVVSNPMYGKARKKLTPTTESAYNAQGDERIQMLGKGYYGNMYDDFEDYIDLWEIYLPRHRRVVTFTGNDVGSAEISSGGDTYMEPLYEQEWLGPDSGPYHILGLGIVPGNAMPKAPLMDLIDLDEATNRAYRKLLKQSDRQKEILLASGGADEDARRIIDANDGEVVKTSNPNGAQVVSFGGPNNNNFQFAMHLSQKFSYQAGNLDAMGGLSPQAKTLGQDEMLQRNSSLTVSDMQDATVKMTSDVMRALCWYWWHDPVSVMETTYSIDGMPELTIPRTVTPDQRRQADFNTTDVVVSPYSFQFSTPESRAKMLNMVVQQTIAPMLPLLQQQGAMFNIQTYLAKLAEYLDMPDLPEIVSFMEPPAMDGQTAGSPGGVSMPAQTERKYTRVSQSAGTAGAEENKIMSALDPPGGSQ